MAKNDRLTAKMQVLRASGLTYAEIGLECEGVSRQAVHQRLAIPRPKPPGRDIVPKLIELREQGLTYIEIASKTGYSKSTIRQKLIKVPIEPRECLYCGKMFVPNTKIRQYCNYKHRDLKLNQAKSIAREQREKEMVDLRVSGLSGSEIASQLKVSNTVVYSVLSKHKLPERKCLYCDKSFAPIMAYQAHCNPDHLNQWLRIIKLWKEREADDDTNGKD